MDKLRIGARCKGLEYAAAVIFALSLMGAFPAARADEHRYYGHEFRESEFHEHQFLDARYHHDRYYPPVGFAFGALPAGYVSVRYQGSAFFFAGGIWYGAAGPGRFVVVAPPLGVVIPVLPLFYATIWVQGVPYYYANNVYYVQSPQGYVVVAPPPADMPVAQTPPSTAAAAPPPGGAYQTPFVQLSMYPNRGQSQQQQARDRYECHQWAIRESGYDPSQSNSPGASEQQMDAYRHAMTACLDTRGYTVW